MIDQASLDSHSQLKGRMTFCSWQVGWRSVLLRSYVASANVDDLITAPTRDQLLVLVTRNSFHVEAKDKGRWRGTTHRPGHLGMIPPGARAHLRWRGTKSHATLQLHLPAAVMQEVADELAEDGCLDLGALDHLSRHDAVMTQAMLALAEAARHGAPELYAETAARFLAMHALLRHGGDARVMPIGLDAGGLRDVEDFMRANLSETLSLGQLAAVAGLGRFQLLRAAKATWGETPLRRLTTLRMAHAKRLLTNTGMPIIEVALDCGYSNPSHFASAFKRHIGVTPTALRGH